MRKSSSEVESPSARSKKSNLPSSKAQLADPIQLSSKTPEKKTLRRTRNRGVALSVAEIRKVAEGLQDRKQQRNNTTSSSLPQVKTARRQIVMPSSEDEPFKLPEKYEFLGKFFDSLDSSIRLLRLKGSMPSFTNISLKIECLTDRRFTHGHLAQLKFVLPEAIVIKKVLVCDERTSCMKPDLHVTINPDAVESDRKLQCGSVPLRKLFRARLKDFCKSHPECDEIPEEALPEPFNRPTKDRLLDMSKTLSSSSATEMSDTCAAHPPSTSCMQNNGISNNAEPATSVELPNQHPAVACHMSQSFRRRFSQKSKENGADKLPSETASSERCPTISAALESSGAPPATPHKTIEHTGNKDESLKNMDTMSTPAKVVSTPPSTPSKTIECTGNDDESLKNMDAMSTPAKLVVSTPSRLMTATPALPPPKRNYMSLDDNSTSSSNKLVRRPPRSRSLKFDTPVKNKEVANEDYADRLPLLDDDIREILPESLIQSIWEKERMAMEERDPAISQAKKRRKIIASLPKLFNMIHVLLRKRSVITKEELVSKIISSHSDIVDRSEVEEQLNLLLELVPEWISEKLASSGDSLFCINKMSNPETIRATLEEAK